MPSPQFIQFYQTLKQSLPTGRLTILEMRAAFEKLMTQFPMTSSHRIEQITFKHCKGAWIKPPKITSDKVMLFFHGGGYSTGSWASHQDLIGRIAQGAGIAVCAVDYRLAPEHHIPAALNDAHNAYDYLLAKGHHPSQIILCGTSAGGGLALSLLLQLKQKLPRAAILLCPWVDLALTGASLQTNDGKDLITRVGVTYAAQTYIGKCDPKDPVISPLYGNLSNLPPLMIQAGTIEILWSEIEALAKKAQASGNKVHFEPYEGMFHTWQLFASKIPEGQEAVDSICLYINSL